MGDIVPFLDIILFLLGGFVILHFSAIPFLEKVYEKAPQNKKIFIAGLLGAVKAFYKVLCVGLLTYSLLFLILSLFSIHNALFAEIIQWAQSALESLKSIRTGYESLFPFVLIVFYILFSYFFNHEKRLLVLEQKIEELQEEALKTLDDVILASTYENIAKLKFEKEKLLQKNKKIIISSSYFSKIFPKIEISSKTIDVACLSLLALSLISIECTNEKSTTTISVEKLLISNTIKNVDDIYRAKKKEGDKDVNVPHQKNDNQLNLLAHGFKISLIKDPIWGVGSSERTTYSDFKRASVSSGPDNYSNPTEEWLKKEKAKEVNIDAFNFSKSKYGQEILKNKLSIQEEIFSGILGYVVSGISPKVLPEDFSLESFKEIRDGIVAAGFADTIKTIFNFKIKIFFLSLMQGNPAPKGSKDVSGYHVISNEARNKLQIYIREKVFPKIQSSLAETLPKKEPDPPTPAHPDAPNPKNNPQPPKPSSPSSTTIQTEGPKTEGPGLGKPISHGSLDPSSTKIKICKYKKNGRTAQPWDRDCPGIIPIGQPGWIIIP